MDLLPTLADLLSLNVEKGVDGTSILPLMLDEQDTLNRDFLYWHFPHYRGSPYSIIRGDSMKLIRKYDPEGLELYNLHEDISEEKNLIEKYPELAKQMNLQLDSWLEDMDARMPKNNENFK